MKTKQAMILAAGFGTRMKDYTKKSTQASVKNSTISTVSIYIVFIVSI